MASILQWCVGVALLICALHITALSGTLSETLQLSPVTANNNASLSIDTLTEILLFTVKNTTEGLRVFIDQPEARHYTPQGITFEDVFLPAECSVAPCNVHVWESVVNESLRQYTLGVPANNSMLLLRFLIQTQSQLRQSTVFVEGQVTESGPNDDCSPTATGNLSEDYLTLCVNVIDKTANVLFIENLDGPLSSVVFNSAIDTKFQAVTFPIEDISFLGYPHSEPDVSLIFFPVGAQQLAMVEPGDFQAYTWTVPNCEGAIQRLKLRSEIDIDSTIPYLIYCSTNYVVVDFADLEYPKLLSSHYYNETGYPIVCRNENNSITAEVAVFRDVGVNATITYNGNNFTIQGSEVDLQNSICFGFKTKLFYLYSDATEGLVLVDLVASNWRVLDSPSPACEISPPKVFENRYILLEEVYNVINVKIRLFDVFKMKFESELNLNYTSDLSFLLTLPRLLPKRSISRHTILFASIGGVVLLIIVVVTIITIGIIIYCAYNKRDSATIVTAHQSLPNNERSPLVTGTFEIPVSACI